MFKIVMLVCFRYPSVTSGELMYQPHKYGIRVKEETERRQPEFAEKGLSCDRIFINHFRWLSSLKFM